MDDRAVEPSLPIPPRETPPARKPYATPRLTRWGTLAAMTQAPGSALPE